MITVLTCGFCVDNGQPTQRGGAATVLLVADEYGRHASRTILAPTGNSTKPQSDLKAAILGLSAIAPRFKSQVVQFSASKYVTSLLDRVNGAYKTKPQKNSELISKLRTISESFSDLVIFLDYKLH